jgi:hypothetical protein
MNYLGIDARNVVKYQCIHCFESIPSEEYKRHSYTHYADTLLPVPDSLQEYIDRFIPVGLVSQSDFEMK